MGNCVSPPAPPSIPPDHPFLGSRIHSSSHGFGFACAVSSESRPASFGMDVGTRRGVQGKACPGEVLREVPGEKRGYRPAGRGQESRNFSEHEGRKPHARSSLTRQAAFFQRSITRPRSPARRDALGRRAREAVPDSRAAVSGAQGPKARKAPANKGGVIWWS